jgi:hypothetical protein
VLHVAAGTVGLVFGPIAILVVNWQRLTGTSGRSPPWAWIIPTVVGSPIIACVNVQVARGRRPKIARRTAPVSRRRGLSPRA